MKLANNIFSYDNYIFDCDGVILDSNFIKSDLFVEIAQEYSTENELVQFKTFNDQNPGLNREKKFVHLFETILGRANYKLDLEKALARFQTVSLERLQSSSIIPGCIDFLQKIKPARKFVVSAAQQDDLTTILKQKNIDQYFHQILGGPTTKVRLISGLNLTGSTLYFGDSNVDMETAMHFNYDFIMLFGATNWKDWREACGTHNVDTAKDFTSFIN